MATNRLTPEERHFFSLVRDATLANPFSGKRMDADLKITGLFEGSPKEVILDKTIAEVRRRFERFRQNRRPT